MSVDLKNLHAKGMSLILLRPKSKRPIDMAWTSQKRKTWEEISLPLEEGKYNVGVRLGDASKLISGGFLGVIDCDVKSKSRKSIQEMNDALRELGIDLKSAPIVASGRGNGSKHVYVQTTEPMRPQKFRSSERRVKVLMPGEERKHSKRECEELTDAERSAGYRIRPAWEIAFMGTGQQTVLPPSVHPDTNLKYTWSSPFTVKHLPFFKPEKHVSSTNTNGPRASVSNTNDSFKAESVNLYDTRLSIPFIKAITEGDGVEDRSATLFSTALAMCRLGFTDNQILSVLSDPKNWISEAAYEHTASRERSRAVNWLRKYTLEKARYETHIMRRFENKPKLTPLSVEASAKVEKKVERDFDEGPLPDLDGKGLPKSTLRNIVFILEKRFGGGLIGLNEFSSRSYFLKNTPYGGVKGKELTDQSDLNLKIYLASHYRFEPSKELCFEAHTLVAHLNAWHPVRRYLDRLEWDKQPRLDGWLREAFGASGPTQYLSVVGRKVLVAAVKRVFEPGCKFDYVMVLEGPQGKGKSMALGGLASPAWFTDSLGDIHSKDVVDQMVGKWIIELAELASIRKAESEYLKSFLSRQVDRVRMSYGRRSQDFPRQSIFIGSTNSSEYLSDETGNRRIWPVKIGDVNHKWLTENRDQLWAEAKARYEIGESVYLKPELELIAKKEQEKRFDVDEWEAEIRAIINKTEEPYVTTQLWRAINLTRGDGHPQMLETKRIGKIMHRLGYKRTVKRVDKALTKCWVKA